ncbi:MAG: hypothetical protein CMF78_02715 [Candidatus Marinimicrobia bacterium]|nr:hypothetical protein [Candidatus Neomarinimicrobiota bacterium]|tara:strand:+ start:1567 stop:3402 length:1836 start_codon:yes stop_codon:yes gene_type:complete
MNNPALTLAFAMAFGMIAQVLARHLRIPGIVLLLGTGLLLGPDALGIVHPSSLGNSLPFIVGFAVAVILFEGGMNLHINRIRREGKTIRQLITTGALVTALGGTVTAKIFLGWDWRISLLFGVIIIVTGPTVITPLLRRLKLRRSVSTVLEAEGVLLDAIGAVIAVVALEIALSPSGLSFLTGLFHIITRLIVGSAIGAAGGFFLAFLLRFRNLIPEGLENVFTLSLVFALFQGANSISPESGIVAVTAAGLVVGNMKTHIHRELREFEEQMTVLLIGMLFILLAADVRLIEVTELGWGGIITVTILVCVLRPLNVYIGTMGSNLNLRQKALLSWIAPRGIVAAAVASLFALELEKHGVDGSQLRAMVFSLIAVTVLLSGLTGSLAAQFLGLKRPENVGWVILGANYLSRSLAKVLIGSGEEVICIDQNPKACRLAEEEGIKVIYGNGLDEKTLLRAEIDTRMGAMGLSSNEEVNLLFGTKAKEIGKLSTILVGIKSMAEGITSEMVKEIGGRIPFGRQCDIEQWAGWIQREITLINRYSLTSPASNNNFQDGMEGIILPLILHRESKSQPIDDTTEIKAGDEVTMIVNNQREKEALEWLSSQGWILAENG